MPDDVPRLSRRPARSLGLRRTRVDAFRVYAMLVVIVGHSEMLLGHTPDANVQGLRLVLNVVSRFAVPLFFIPKGSLTEKFDALIYIETTSPSTPLRPE